jgi:hypothetical protein
MSPPGRPKGEYRSAEHEGCLMSAPGRPKRSYRSAKHGGRLMTARHAPFEPHPALAVLDGPDLLHIEFDDLLKYHGLGSVGGVAIAFRAMHAAFARLSPAGAPIERRSVSVLSAFAGPGATDAFEMVLRVRTEGRLHVDTDLAAPGGATAPRGRFFFQFETPQAVCALGLRDGVVAPGFNALARKAARARSMRPMRSGCGR